MSLGFRNRPTPHFNPMPEVCTSAPQNSESQSATPSFLLYKLPNAASTQFIPCKQRVMCFPSWIRRTTERAIVLLSPSLGPFARRRKAAKAKQSLPPRVILCKPREFQSSHPATHPSSPSSFMFASREEGEKRRSKTGGGCRGCMVGEGK